MCVVNAEMAQASHRRSRGWWGRVLVTLDAKGTLAGLDVLVQAGLACALQAAGGATEAVGRGGRAAMQAGR